MRNDNLVTFEQAEMLARNFDFRSKCEHAYDADSGSLLTTTLGCINHNHTKSWTGTDWRYARYSAPTKDEAIDYLLEVGMMLNEKLLETYNKERKNA